MSAPLRSKERPPRNPTDSIPRTGRRRAFRWGLAAAFAAVIIGGVMWVILARRAASRRASTGGAVSGAGTGMQDMAGMADSSRTAASNAVHFTA